MKILICCSRDFYDKIPVIKEFLDGRNNQVYYPNCYDDPTKEQKMWALGEYEHQAFKAQMFRQCESFIAQMDAVLVLNFDKTLADGSIYENYIGGSTFLEMYDAFRMGKKIFLLNDIPDGILHDEIHGFGVTIINNNLELVL